ncbi:poly-gamma-glutamate biosynthesis protein PgsC/CapC [Nannocystis sp. ILAH1]|uniref:poly-gamma-glutamate biosynthesis protein PgsC/CapC n=1 Tax=unclassified Nannocystis TaxID=2627009 RepID=UPI00226D9CFC|nr:MULTISPECIES: poly-gamma-glutamate biosynthesis protein PgsC/CapC [unclassified Nannocystis]MCY0987258.1 poly-gamma-glutamate biosynthesis protein PgsC/CapC [Nannocystis sp. ILAH1]MCY1070946.1 poly-gamma-glutamate biosynthesis protein PgsC/CapC [Nannocystis sp. RBIL2]
MTPFEVLPHGGLDQSILIPVLVGVYVALFFTETFGWVFVGLVVPGYLASVLALQPTTAAVIVLEAIVTYLLARGLAYALAPTGVWAPFFGRDRFFVIVLASVLVRQHDQLWILPALSSWLELQLGSELPPVREFYSIGLVLVPLTANMLWKPGLVRGLGPLAVVVGLTYATLELVLLPLTNLSLSSFELLYEDSAIDFLGHARAYVLLLTTATLAARFNLRFGWDFGGILVPALLGLLWFTPIEMMVTLAEACILWSITKLLLRYTPLKRYNLEGPRKLALVFSLSVALKWMLSLIVSVTMPGMRARELFGFGYLLSTLLAIRMLPKKATRRVLLPTITTAFAGWLIGSALGLGLDVAAPVPTPVPAFNPRNTSDRLLRSEAGALALGHVRAELAPPRLEAPPASALIAHAEAWSALAAWIAAPTDDAAATARDAAARADLGIHAMSAPTGLFHHVSYAISPIERGVVHTSWPSALVVPGASGPAIVVPRPVAEAPAAEAAGPLCAALSCRLVLVAGRDQVPGVIDTTFSAALARLAPEGAVELRADFDAPPGRPLVHLEAAAPIGLPALQPATPRGGAGLPPMALAEGAPPLLLGAPWGEGRRAVVRMHPETMRASLLQGAPEIRSAPALMPWLAEQVRAWSERPDSGLAAPSVAELTFLERHVAEPLIHGFTEDRALAARFARLVDAEVWQLRDCGSRRPCRALVAGGEILVLGTGPSKLVIEAIRVPEEAGTWRLAAELFSAASGRALLIAISRSGAGMSAFTPAQALHQALSADEAGAPRTIVQIRGLGARPGAPADALAIGRPRAGVGELPPVLSDMLTMSGPLSFVPRWRLLEDAPELAALVGVRDALIAFSAAFTADAAAILWFPPALRRVYALGDPCLDLRRLSALDLVPTGRSCGAWVRDEAAMALGGVAPGVVDVRTVMSKGTVKEEPSARKSGRAAAEAREAEARGKQGTATVTTGAADFMTALAQVEAYAESNNLHWLRLVLAGPGLRLQAGLGRTTGRGFLSLCETGADRRCALVWLGPALPGRTVVPSKIRAVGPALWRRNRTLLVDGEER